MILLRSEQERMILLSMATNSVPGSIRIHDRKLQSEIFDMLGLTKEEQQKKFGFMLDAFRYGAPPHGGMALGIDRIAMLCCGTDNIKDVVAFPENNIHARLDGGLSFAG